MIIFVHFYFPFSVHCYIIIYIHKHFRGQQVNFPMRLYSKEYIEEYLIKNYNGKNLKELSKKLDYTTNWLRKMLNKIEFS
ncbi:Mor transcription activator family protein [Clostridium perfringens]|uniref:Mor transcription activator family protein n=1 Tax=Clostridium perfringens TaxID=1502 RepID=UPI000E4B83EE|nr:Mor transcription activator family protein [Clostridium perfringens]MDK0592559.1 Mor transcription activator family protein [Clostridium perfringens]MDK0595613.1 Mor transcription activator family protein [Clostridium perfringens]MDK0689826.1 Mor transcription activator family protein [Clostridium perfringens]MDM0786576.1 Mor transcription activator family protein [Clostridium perfringens]RHN27938.1 Mor transcription activator family protein [Clostridium perfringens]